MATPLEKELHEHVNRLAQVITEQEQLMGAAVLGLENSHQQMSEVQAEVTKPLPFPPSRLLTSVLLAQPWAQTVPLAWAPCSGADPC